MICVELRRVAIVATVVAACGGSNKPAPAPVAADPVKPVAAQPGAPVAPLPRLQTKGDHTGGLLGDPKDFEPPATALKAPPSKAPPPPATPIYDRLRDDDGAVPGLTGFSTKRVRDPKRCGGLAILVKRSKKIAQTDATVAAMFALEFPLGLDFSDAKKAGSQLKFTTWVQTFTKTAAEGRSHYEGQFASKDPSVKVAAAARLAQLSFRAASVLARAEVPADLRSHELVDEVTTAYCDALAEKAEPLLALGNQAREACQKHASTAPAGWWAELCKAP